MSIYDIVIKGGTVIDGLRTPRYKADVAIKDGTIVEIGRHRRDRRRGGRRRRRQDRRAGLRRRAHALRQPGLLGPVVHDVGLARRHHRRDRQLRVRVRALQGRGPGPGDAVPVAQRGGAAEDDAGRHAVGLGDVPGVPRQRRPHPEGRQRHVAGAAGAALRLRHRRRQGQGAARQRRGARPDVPAPRRGDGGRRLRLELADLRRRRQRPARLRRHADGHRRDDRARDRRLLARSAQDRPRHHADHRPARHRRAHRPRERPTDHLERARPDRVGQPARRVPVPAPRDDRPARRAQPGGRPARLRVGADRAVQVRDRPRGLQPHGHLPGLAGGQPGHARGEDRQVRPIPSGAPSSGRRSTSWAAASAPPATRSPRSR